uniref:Coat protein n=1 Tax=Leviviridae sp. TaxID=2027243 RepID=A0A514DCR7_9VIRU|nr:MAG: hypothetical protein H1Rhizo25885e4861_000002 [Leviviridae sp.]
MPQAVNITVKNGAATPVDKVYELLTPAASDGSSALWALKEGANSKTFNTVEASSRRNAARDAQKLSMTYAYPSTYVDAASTLTLVKNRAVVNISVTIPDDFPEAKKDDLVAFTANLTSATLVKAMIRDARAAN